MPLGNPLNIKLTEPDRKSEITATKSGEKSYEVFVSGGSSSIVGFPIDINKQRGVDVRSWGPSSTSKFVHVLLHTHRNLRMILCNISCLKTFIRGYRALAEKRLSSKGYFARIRDICVETKMALRFIESGIVGTIVQNH